ncbi:MAG: phosphoribosylanthranilate isomerase [Melioribacteraceae bacterium]|nr:phosphoribosylanthranilate isomerase [Melioribacteraceae bacterium]MCF8356794.1 phosphoribosylanthranilate isomerase [Melioribacteraceae bacterium]MCF8396174.1 phosphoribosylanthranilate isomerase [Melioribacteraceae bacterium]MCF8421129.1 phosphoribosylanthranilate isomerase [Melioribacteraceae bacterium]
MIFDEEYLIQVAGIIDQAEADILIQNDVKYLGFPLRLPVHKEDLSEHQAAAISLNLPFGFNAVLITYLDNADEIIEFSKSVNMKIVQLHGDISLNELIRLRELYPELKIIKSLVIREDNQDELEFMLTELSPHVDAFITDTFDPSTGASGATGKTHDWNISRKFVEISPKPVILAGGLNPANVYKAIKFVKPAGVDVHTRVENESGRKNPLLIKKFVSESKKAFEELRK